MFPVPYRRLADVVSVCHSLNRLRPSYLALTAFVGCGDPSGFRVSVTHGAQLVYSTVLPLDAPDLPARLDDCHRTLTALLPIHQPSA